MEKISCVIIDDEKLACDRLSSLLRKYDDIEIVGISQNPDDGICKTFETLPDIVFIDVEMPIKSGFDVVCEINKNDVKTKFIFVTAYSQYAIKAIRKEAFDYLLKPIDVDDLTDALYRYKKSMKINMEIKIPKSYIEKYHLSKRELEIIQQIALNKTSQEIAGALFISKHTVDTHRRNILNKMQLDNTRKLSSFISSISK